MTDRSCLNCKHTYHSEICRECCVGDKFEPRPNAPQPNKQLAELLNLRKRVEAQRTEIRRLQLGTDPKRLTVGAFWHATTNDIFLERDGREPLKLPAGDRLQLEHAELVVKSIQIRTRASEAPYFLVTVEENI